jgi:dihydrofolate reductase
MKVSIIVAMGEGGVIGRGGALPWHLPADLARFRRITMGHPLIMGRRTYESIGRPLPGRASIVLSRQGDFRPAGVQPAGSLEEALDLARRVEAAQGTADQDAEVFVIGGADVYRQAMPSADHLYITRVHVPVFGDRWFTEPDSFEWTLIDQVERPADSRNPHRLTFQHYMRRKDSRSCEEADS